MTRKIQIANAAKCRSWPNSSAMVDKSSHDTFSKPGAIMLRQINEDGAFWGGVTVKHYSNAIGVIVALLPVTLMATVFGSLRGIVHDPDHRPVPGARLLSSPALRTTRRISRRDVEGDFETPSLPAGAYRVTVTKEGFAAAAQEVVVVSGSAPVLHFQLAIGATQQTVTVTETALAAAPEVATPTTLVSRSEIRTTPGADLSNSLNLITDYVPGAWITHDQLHVRGGHQVTWAIDGVPIPNTNIASNVGPADRSQGHRLSGGAARRLFGGSGRPDLRRFQCGSADRIRAQQRRRVLRHVWHVPPDQRTGELRQPYREARLLRQREWQPQRLRAPDSRPRRVARSRVGSRRIGLAHLQSRCRPTNSGSSRRFGATITRFPTIRTRRLPASATWSASATRWSTSPGCIPSSPACC